MREERRWIALVILSAGVIVALLILHWAHFSASWSTGNRQRPASTVYNPYPPGILPSNLSSEIARVLREVDFIESRALARWHALTPPILTDQSPVLQSTGTEATETLGELMLFDKSISPDRNQACASCHMPYAGFSPDFSPRVGHDVETGRF
jgi:cytochrome c peroxidase